jgi:hypothetical protein
MTSTNGPNPGKKTTFYVHSFSNCFQTVYRYKDDCGRTALHWASSSDNLPALEILLQECKRQKVVAYNCKNNYGYTPVFWAKTSSCIESFLNAGLENLELVKVDGKTLLHRCVERDNVSELIASSLKGQWSMVYEGFTPIEKGEKEGKSCIWSRSYKSPSPSSDQTVSEFPPLLTYRTTTNACHDIHAS